MCAEMNSSRDADEEREQPLQDVDLGEESMARQTGLARDPDP